MWEVRGSQRVAKQIALLDKSIIEKYSRAFEQLSKYPIEFSIRLKKRKGCLCCSYW